MYPLRPIYCIFSNIVATSDPLDHKLLQETAQGLDSLSQTHASMKAIHKLCKSLINLSEPFIQGGLVAQEYQIAQIDPGSPSDNQLQDSHSSERGDTPRDVPFYSTGLYTPVLGDMVDMGQVSNGQIFQEQTILVENEPTQGRVPIREDLDWQLFCAQPLLDFFDMETIA